LSIARARLVAGSGRMSRLGAARPSGHHDLMEQIEVCESSKLPNQTDLGTSNSLVRGTSGRVLRIRIGAAPDPLPPPRCQPTHARGSAPRTCRLRPVLALLFVLVGVAAPAIMRQAARPSRAASECPLAARASILPASINERQALERERAELPAHIANYQRKLDATPIESQERRERLERQIRRVQKRMTEVHARLTVP
jgi:hypothetical protein